MKMLIRLLRNEEGTTAIEYGLITLLISIAAIAGMTAIGNSVKQDFTTLSADL